MGVLQCIRSCKCHIKKHKSPSLDFSEITNVVWFHHTQIIDGTNPFVTICETLWVHQTRTEESRILDSPRALPKPVDPTRRQNGRSRRWRTSAVRLAPWHVPAAMVRQRQEAQIGAAVQRLSKAGHDVSALPEPKVPCIFPHMHRRPPEAEKQVPPTVYDGAVPVLQPVLCVRAGAAAHQARHD